MYGCGHFPTFPHLQLSNNVGKWGIVGDEGNCKLKIEN